MVKPCLIIVFNHRYDKNIPVLKQLYAGRFSHIYFLVPFYNGTDPSVIPVYESSHYFQSFFAQGFHRFFKEEFTHYIFVGDDCILNPAINESNFLEQTGLPQDADFIPDLIELHRQNNADAWWHSFKGIDFFDNRKGAEVRRELPSREQAMSRFEQHGVSIQPVTKKNIFGTRTPSGKKKLQHLLFKEYHWRIKWKIYRKGSRVELPYPVVGSYADILIVTKKSIADFCRYCGLMAATGLFVELAIPTALLLASERVVQEKELRLRGLALWSPGDIAALEEKHHASLRHLLSHFPQEQLFYHPVKLSKWKNDL